MLFLRSCQVYDNHVSSTDKQPHAENTCLISFGTLCLSEYHEIERNTWPLHLDQIRFKAQFGYL